MSSIFLRLIGVIVSISLVHSYLDPALAASENLVWKPYLQQLTDTRVIILWTTKAGANPVVRYSTDTGYNFVANGSSRLLNELGAQLHRVELTGLQPNTTYYYKVYTEGEDLLPDEALSFQTAPYPGSITPFTFLAFGDYGKGTIKQIGLRDQMLLDTFSFILTTGDNAYSDGTYLEFDEKVFQIYADIFSRAAIFPTLGNHDYHTDKGAPYLDLFDLPDNVWRIEDVERYYSFDYGNVHFTALDSTIPYKIKDDAASDDMFDWLRDDLSQTTQLWKIVAFHYSPYSTGNHGSVGLMQTQLAPIFEEYGVDLVLTGHDHIYQRSQPLLGGIVTPVAAGGIVYIVTGAGAEADPCGNASWLAFKYCSMPSGIYARITVNGGELTVEAIDENGAVEDTYTINSDSLVITPVKSVLVSGPTTGPIKLEHTFTAAVSPVTTTLPITYTWQATGQPLIMDEGGLSQSISLTWNAPGTQLITVTATNAGGAVTDTHTVTLGLPKIYLPIVVQQ